MIAHMELTQLSTERIRKGFKGKVDINHHTNVDSAKLVKHPATGEPAAEIDFTFRTKYKNGDTEIGNVHVKGFLIWVRDAEKIAEYWKKEKKLSKDVAVEVINAIINRCAVSAIIASREVLLPPPIPMPQMKAKAKSPDLEYIG